MTEARLHTVQCLSPAGLHKVSYKEWGDPDNPDVLVCVHGVTRVGDDFDMLAQKLCDRFRVVCPDIVGRGRSGWLADPHHYQLPQYVADMVTLIARLDMPRVTWLGTSMGGLIGMGLAAMSDTPIRRLVLNDVGPELNFEALQRIGQYIGQEMKFRSFEEGEVYIRAVSAPFGPHDRMQWRKLASDVLRPDKEGLWIRHYDPGLAIPLRDLTPDAVKRSEAKLWAAWDAIRCPTLLIRGAQSDLLTPAVAQQMTQRGPHAKLVEAPGVGHAPTFVHADQIALVEDFLLGASS
jgi:pimeloyl-ACP methyl ester carboxylesterase